MSLTFEDPGIGCGVWVGVHASYFRGPGDMVWGLRVGECLLLSRTRG